MLPHGSIPPQRPQELRRVFAGHSHFAGLFLVFPTALVRLAQSARAILWGLEAPFGEVGFQNNAGLMRRTRIT